VALFDQLAALFGGGAHVAPAAGQGLIQSLLAKHGSAGIPDLPKIDGAPAVGAKVGTDLTDPVAKTANVLDGLKSFDSGPAPASPTTPLDFGAAPDVLGAHGADPITSAFAANAAKPRNGFLQHIGDFLHSNEGRAEAMRFAAGAFSGGMGGGLKAATDFADQRHHEQIAGASAAADRALRERELNDTRDYRTGELDLTRGQNDATRQHYERGDANDQYRTNSENWRARLHEGGETSRTAMHEQGENVRTGANIGEKRFEHATPSGDVETQQSGETARNTQDNQASIMAARIGHPTGGDTIHLKYQATPETLGAKHAAAVAAVRPSQVQPNDAPVKISSDAEYNALPSGKKFTGPDGQVRVKP
jgi:hypothetical protein